MVIDANSGKVKHKFNYSLFLFGTLLPTGFFLFSYSIYCAIDDIPLEGIVITSLQNPVVKKKNENYISFLSQVVHKLNGHLDYSFASAWHPNGITFATGNQDKTCRVWDIRNLSKSTDVLRGNIGAIRSVRFTSDGQFMAMAEPADFVHVFDVQSGYNKHQELDFFGEISGVSFSPDTEALFVGVWDRTYGSLLQYRRVHNHLYHDLF